MDLYSLFHPWPSPLRLENQRPFPSVPPYSRGLPFSFLAYRLLTMFSPRKRLCIFCSLRIFTVFLSLSRRFFLPVYYTLSLFFFYDRVNYRSFPVFVPPFLPVPFQLVRQFSQAVFYPHSYPAGNIARFVMRFLFSVFSTVVMFVFVRPANRSSSHHLTLY